MIDLRHFHQPGQDPGEMAEPPACCANLLERRHTVALDLAVHAERQRIVLSALADLDAWEQGALTVLSQLADPEAHRLTLVALKAGRDAIRRAGCICPLVEVTSLVDREPRYLHGGDSRCGFHGDT